MCHQRKCWKDDPVFIDPLVTQLLPHLIIAVLHLVHSSRKVRVKANLLVAIKDFPFYSCCLQHSLLVSEIQDIFLLSIILWLLHVMHLQQACPIDRWVCNSA